MSDEVRVTSHTGGQKGSKQARYDLIPAAPLKHLAELYGKGAEKYTQYGDCTCVAGSLSTPRASVAPATRRTSDGETPSSPNGSGRTTDSGSLCLATLIESTKWTEPGRAREGQKPTGPTDSPATSTTPSWPSLVESVAPSPSISTTTTRQGVSEAHSATDATSGSATSKAGTSSTEKQHEPGCPALVVIQSGDRNWERGYNWSLSFAALNRHLWQFWAGEDVDPETGKPHLAAVAWHAFALLEFMGKHPDFDDRPGKP